MNPYELWVARPELMRLSGFTLPLPSIPVDQRARLGPLAVRDRLTVQPRSTDQIRTMERHGLLDDFLASPARARTRSASRSSSGGGRFVGGAILRFIACWMWRRRG
jgi:hypothetical protein